MHCFSMFANEHAELYVAGNFSPEPMLQLKDNLLGCEVFVDILRPDKRQWAVLS